ncbi:hypothetical protein D8674_033053 [Pyrus ussuriensis x Pyrus communis]|uniref:Uncharacterized protein n=1 Tax=Pyrus ussuriensis x Pyrus communis TaxID=2448454 RepID=A0A5N5HKU3_9ROSA|nr:hypothetical protein D8674_033053 [Pyrus ussuriensis x Pyrus communis]
MNLASKICTGIPLFVLQHRADAITERDLNNLISESHSCGAAAMLPFCCWLRNKLHASFSDWQTASGSTREASHGAYGWATTNMDHLDLIGTSRGGLDHPEEIHRINGSGTEHLDLIGTSWEGLDHPEEIHGIDNSDTERHGRYWWQRRWFLCYYRRRR